MITLLTLLLIVTIVCGIGLLLAILGPIILIPVIFIGVDVFLFKNIFFKGGSKK